MTGRAMIRGAYGRRTDASLNAASSAMPLALTWRMPPRIALTVLAAGTIGFDRDVEHSAGLRTSLLAALSRSAADQLAYERRWQVGLRVLIARVYPWHPDRCRVHWRRRHPEAWRQRSCRPRRNALVRDRGRSADKLASAWRAVSSQSRFCGR